MVSACRRAGHTIGSYFDKAEPLDVLRRSAHQPRPAYDVHHIVEKTPAEAMTKCKQEGLKTKGMLDAIKEGRYMPE